MNELFASRPAEKALERPDLQVPSRWPGGSTSWRRLIALELLCSNICRIKLAVDRRGIGAIAAGDAMLLFDGAPQYENVRVRVLPQGSSLANVLTTRKLHIT
jgi:hypothetical protein